jgi:hypothetical protein
LIYSAAFCDAGNEGSGSFVEQGLSDLGASNDGVDPLCTFRSFAMVAAVTLLFSSLLHLSALSRFLFMLFHFCCFIFFSFIFGAIFFLV